MDSFFICNKKQRERGPVKTSRTVQLSFSFPVPYRRIGDKLTRDRCKRLMTYKKGNLVQVSICTIKRSI